MEERKRKLTIEKYAREVLLLLRQIDERPIEFASTVRQYDRVKNMTNEILNAL